MKNAGVAGTDWRIARLYGAVTVGHEAPPVAWMVRFEVTAVVGVPDSKPADESARPAGSVPVATANV